LKKNPKRDILELESDTLMHSLVIDTINKDTVRYGVVLDGLIILKYYGYNIPDCAPGMVHRYDRFWKLVNKFTNELLLFLKSLGYPADRASTNRHLTPPADKHGNCYNLVFVRYPFVDGYRMDKSSQNIMSRLKYAYLTDLDLSKLRKVSPKLVGHMEDMATGFITITDDVKELLDTHIGVPYEKFSLLASSERDKLVEYFSTKRSVGHDKYNKNKKV
jgi:hypothetical protein